MDILGGLDPSEPLIYRRSTRVDAYDNTVTAEMEDDFHHFRVSLSHDGHSITSIVGDSVRFPWSTCGRESENKIRELKGLGLDALYKQLSAEERYSHCTHLFDLVQLAINHAVKAPSTRLFQVAITLTPSLGVFKAELKRDSSDLFLWDIENGTITNPAPYSGLTISGLAPWVRAHQSPEMIEAVLILQRAIHVSLGKIFDWSSASKASEMNLPPTCHAFQPINASRGLRVSDNIRDFSASFDSMLVK